MERNFRHFLTVCAGLLALLTASCVTSPYGSDYGGYPGSTIEPYGAPLPDGGHVPVAPPVGQPLPSYRSTPSYSSSVGFFSSRSRCSSCGYNPCRCSRYRPHTYAHTSYPRHGHSSHGHSSSKDMKHPSGAYKITAGSVGRSKTKPTGYHPPSWYRDRGYDLNRLTLKNEKGEVYKKKSSSSSKKSSSSSSKKKKK